MGEGMVWRSRWSKKKFVDWRRFALYDMVEVSALVYIYGIILFVILDFVSSKSEILGL